MARSERFSVELTATDSASQVIDQVAAATDKLAEGAVNVDITADDEATEVIEEVAGEVEDLDGATAETELSADDEASDVIGEVTGNLEDLDGSTADADLTATDDATGTIDDVAGAISDLDGDSATVEVTVEGDDESTITAVSDALTELDGSTATASVDVQGTGDDEVGGALDGIMSDLGTLGAGAVTGLAAGALLNVFSASADQALDVQNLADATGSTLKLASGVVEQMDFVGVSAQTVETMVGRVNKKLEGSPEIAGRLGIVIGENQTPLETFVQVVDALNSGQLTANDRLSLATEIFGKKGALSVLAVKDQVGNLSDAIDDMPEWQVVTQSDVDNALAFKQTMDQVGDILGEFSQLGLNAFVTQLQGVTRLLDVAGNGLNLLIDRSGDTPENPLTEWFAAMDHEQVQATLARLDELGTSIDTIEGQFLHLADVKALLAVGAPPEAIAQLDLTVQGYKFLGQQMAETQAAADLLTGAFEANQVSTEEWSQMTADGTITQAEVQAAIDNTDVALQESTTSAEAYAAAFEESTAQIEAHKEALQGDIDLLDDHIEKLNDQADAIAGTGDSYLDQRENVRDAQDALDKYHDSMDVAKDDTRTATQIARDQERALDNVVRSYDKVAQGVEDAAEQQAEANGTTLTAIQRTDLHNSSLLDQAATLQGPEKQALLEHTLRINGIPESRITKIFTDNDPNDLAQVERELDNASRSRAALIQARIDQAAADQAAYELRVLTTPRSVLVTPIIQTTRGGVNVQANATGDPYTAAGLSLVGEQGPELVQYAGAAALVGTQGPEVVDLPLGAQITPAGPTDELLRNRGRGDTFITNNTVHMPAGTASSTVNQLRRYARRNGTLVESAS